MPAKTASRANYKGQLTKVKRAIEKYMMNFDELKQPTAGADLTKLLEEVDQIEAKFSDIQTQIIAEAPPDLKEKEMQDMATFVEDCNMVHFEITKLHARRNELCNPPVTALPNTSDALQQVMQLVQTQFKAVMQTHREDMETVLSNSMQHSMTFQQPMGASGVAKLEPLKVPTFSGVYSEWKSFQDLFTSIVHNNTHLTGAQKMHYLKLALQGEASLTIAHFGISDENYSVAWKMVQDRYDDNHKIVNSHIETFLKQSAVAQPSASGLRKLFTTSASILQAMEALKVTQRDPWLIHIIREKLDAESQVLWSREINDDIPTWQQFEAFLHKRCKSLELCSPPIPKSNQNSNQKPKPKNEKSRGSCYTAQSQSSQKVCPFCKKPNHKLFRCRDFLSQTASKRLEITQSLKMCQNCLSDTHATTDCSYSLCKQCNQKHNTLLHEAFGSPLPSGSQSTGVDSSTGTVCCANVMGDSSLHVLLATAQVKLLDDDNNEHSCRVLLDAGSQFNFITTHLVQRLRLKLNPAEFIIKGIGSVTQISKHRTDVRLRLNQDVSEIGCAVVKKITGNLPNCFIDRESFTIPDSIQLADPDWHRNQPVDMLIGGEFFWHFLKDQTITLGPNAPLLKDSVFGWLVVGPHFNKPTVNSKSIGQCNVATSMASMEATMQKFWKVEEVPKRQEKISEQDEAEKIFQSTTTRTEDGRYMVTLPFTEEIKELGNNRSSATHQFLQLERRLDRNSDLKAEYTKVIHEYLSLNIIEEVPACELDRPSYYLPHHAVVKLHAISTKLRIVFNGSAISQTGRSLNHCLRIGPVVQPPLVEILWRFRIHQFALTCDVVKMYLQILMCPEHRDYVRFMWRDHKTGDIRHFRFRTVCFGLASSPFLATRTLIQLAEEEGHLFPLAAKAIRECFYVDDCLVSLPSISDLMLLREELIQLLGRAQFQLAKFKSNCPSETDDNGDSQSHDLADDTVKTLGLIWNSTSDTFQFNLSDSIPTENVTKRQMLSAIAKIYDPIGLIGPIISHAKLMMQEVWLLKVDWDTPVPSDLQHKWSTFIKDLPSIESLRIPRWISSIASPTHVELHAFADASSVAYGAVIFYVSEDANGHKSSRLLTSKSKVVPLKDKETEDPAITIPKAELCAAKMAAELMSSVSEALGVTQCFYWTDAAVVLYQIHTPSEKREIFVRNRVRDILKLTKAEEWRHVASADNPADPLSRGCLASQAVTNTLWWSGPEWLVQGSDHWPAAFDPKTFSMGRKPAVALTSTNAMSPAHDTNDSLHSILHMRISTFTRMQRVLAWVIRAKNIFKVRKGRVTRSTQENMITGPLTVDELQQAETFLVKREQEQHFAAILTAVRNGSLDHTSHFKFIRRLRPFIDSEGILRVGGRLSNSCESYDVQHPIILPKGRLSLAYCSPLSPYYASRRTASTVIVSQAAILADRWPKVDKTCCLPLCQVFQS
ncbi:uncharacterized protein LOC129786957 [Lutzomyia longipalpis]|uniref:uncharacterized protein LOC129786957 n=1 Tax=Lutzomyia longipalpis TaxID=7200 RepID=UPI0024838EC2|nr:uncharacterized protein LOC129786957 [Lutzomyia longipalpis]